MMDFVNTPNGRGLDAAPPQPPEAMRRNLAQMAMGYKDAEIGAAGFDPAVQMMATLGEARKSLFKLAALCPSIAQGIQQIISGLETVVSEQAADVTAGNYPGSGGSMLGGGAPAPPQAPPMSPGML